MSQEKTPQFSIGFPIPQNKPNELPYDLSKAVLLRRQSDKLQLIQELVEDGCETNFTTPNSFNTGLQVLLSRLDNYKEIQSILKLSPIAFDSIEYSARGIIAENSLQFYHLNHELFTKFKKQTSRQGVQLIATLGRSGLEMISNPNFTINPSYLNCKVYNEYMKWLHGDNRTI